MLVTCVCKALGDDSHNHVGGVGVSKDNKFVSTKAYLSRVFVFFLVCVFVFQFNSS
jgi:hypothetical protein